jgi:hypothetical protein
MTKYWRQLAYGIVLIILFLMPQTYASLSSSTFTSAEHVVMGNNVVLRLGTDDPGRTDYVFHLPSGLNVTYGDILSIGDLYGTSGKPISRGLNLASQKRRFLVAFNMFADDSAALAEAMQIVNTIHEEQTIVANGMEQGQKPEDVYKQISDEFDRRLNCITGGGCSPSSWWLNPGRYLKLAYDNFDHFGKNAWRTYQIGHQLAIDKAIKAHASGDLEELKLAYAINAFACHFLADRFSAGHIRTPRTQLPKNVNPTIVGNILTSYMHNEESRYGLHVHNLQGKTWTAYGDRSFLNPICAEHRHILQQVLQSSADEVFSAFKYGEVSKKDDLLQYLPHPDEIQNMANNDISPMFYWDGNTKKLYRRVDLSNPYDRHWTTNWWGWSTLYELRDHNGMRASDQAILALSNYSNEALHHGLITNKDMLAYLYHSAY